MKDLHFNYVDGIVLVLLAIGIFRGRKRGMSEELLNFLQWLMIVFVGARIYEPLGSMLSAQVPFSLLTCFVTVYVGFAILTKILFLQIQRAVGEKLLGSNFFGATEYYLGMLAGMIRFACMILMGMALINARLITQRELAATARMQSKNFEGISFPTFGSIQQAVLYESFVGKNVKEHLPFVLIQSTEGHNIALPRGEGRAFNEVLGPVKK